ncbi:MAG: adenosylcobinamide-GDP ribazoletransferase [Chloroflexota bacterium]|nr:adenosylcobinamide-GDP ribazoletransferase [Chloroflexota bacterium]
MIPQGADTSPGKAEGRARARPWAAPGTRFLAALQFLTVAPPLVRRPFTPEEMGGAVGYFALVGLLLGGLLAGLNWLLRMALPVSVASALVLAAWLALTGALHFDGFLDTCDALPNGRSPGERLRILRDVHVGSFAVAGGVLLLLVKYAALVNVPSQPIALVMAPALGRWAMALAVVAFPYGRPEGLGRAMKDHAGWREGLLATAFALAVAWPVARWAGLVAAAVALAVGWGVARFALARLPGLTGDIYGAICELVEAAVLITLVAM